MPLIDTTWPTYFETRHEGLGTTYERLILHRLFEGIHQSHGIRSVLEAPTFGMTGISGINSLWWAAQGAEVTLVDHDPGRMALTGGVWDELSLPARLVLQDQPFIALPFDRDRFDLVWNFAALWYVPRLEGLLGEMARVSRKVILICVPNRWNVFYQLRRLRLKKIPHLHPEHNNPARISAVLGQAGWQPEQQGFMDVPPWPDIAMNKEDLLPFLRWRQRGKSGGGVARPVCILDHFTGKETNLQKKILRFGFLENLPDLFKRFWAHHQYFVYVPRKDVSR